MTDQTDSRDVIGYGRNPPDAAWPEGAHIAVQFAVNDEEGGESCLLGGDAALQAFLAGIVGAQPLPGQRHWSMQSVCEYGSRAGFWRLWRLFTSRAVPVTVFGVATALARNPEAVAAMKEAEWEIASGGLKWIGEGAPCKEDERAHMAEAIRIHQEVTGSRPLGWYAGRASVHSIELAMEEGGFLYSSDSYADDLPYWMKGPNGPHLIIPHALDTSDMRFALAQGGNSGDQFFAYLKDAFDVLYEEGRNGRPKMLNVGLHCRLAGRPACFAALQRFVDYVLAHDRVWVPRRIDIAWHWIAQHRPAA